MKQIPIKLTRYNVQQIIKNNKSGPLNNRINITTPLYHILKKRNIIIKKTIIINGLHTPFNKLNNKLSNISTINLTTPLIKKLITKYNLKNTNINKIIIKQVLQANYKQIPSQQTLIKTNYPQLTNQ